MLHSSQLLNSRFWADFNWKRQSRVVVFERGAEKKNERVYWFWAAKLASYPRAGKGARSRGGGEQKSSFFLSLARIHRKPPPQPPFAGGPPLLEKDCVKCIDQHWCLSMSRRDNETWRNLANPGSSRAASSLFKSISSTVKLFACSTFQAHGTWTFGEDNAHLVGEDHLGVLARYCWW